MTAAVEIRDRALLFGWDTHTDNNRHEDTFVHGSHLILVDYHRDGTVAGGKLFHFFRADDLHLEETTPSRNRKTAIVAWLARLGS